MKNHKQLSITILSLCIVIGAIVFSEFTPASWYEISTFREVEVTMLKQIFGMATCSCPDDACPRVFYQCTWSTAEGCKGCEQASIKVPHGKYQPRCLKDGKTDTFSCCQDTCYGKDGLGCKEECDKKSVERIHKCTSGTNYDNCVKFCYASPYDGEE